ncbi:MAG: zinc ribbon domain-containing protein [Paraprevotella sp.]|nr:zinc ribbon domain-containing protein [Paraprevotella sp.]
MRKKHSILLWMLLGTLFLTSCYYQKHDYSDEWDLTEGRRNSLDFAEGHHYTKNYNFRVVGDSLSLQIRHPQHNPGRTDDLADSSVAVCRGDRVVVADMMFVPEDSVDSVWIKVARDQSTMGWIHETDLLREAIPADPISSFIHLFSNVHLIYRLLALGLLLIVYLVRRMRRKRFHIVHFDDIGSCYPTLLCLTLSGAATLYASVQKFVPDTWVEFYFHPTLNPFGLPFILGLFLTSLWLIVILAIASAEDVFRQLPLREAVLYLFALLGVCAACYLFFSVATLYYVGYPCLLGYAGWALRRYYLYARCPYVCGRCGAKLRSKGRCPHCGAWNE